jgi:hypothetical protein
MMWNLVTNGISMEWWWLMVGVGLMAGILLLHDVRFQPRTSVPIPKFVGLLSTLRTNFGIVRTLASL